MSDEIINRVAESGLMTLDLEDYYPREEIVEFNLEPFLFLGQAVKEKDFRAALQKVDWLQFTGKVVALSAPANAIIPVWAYMLVVTYLEPVAKEIFYGDAASAREQLFLNNIYGIDATAFTGRRVVIKGCGSIDIGAPGFIYITKLLRPVAKSLMYGEPCSTVPLYKAVASKENS